jgi:peptidoglycan-N-acetylmuramic acid deacetylase
MKKVFFVCFILILMLNNTILHAKPIYWGVYHANPGQIPVGNSDDAYLNKYGAYYHGHSDGEKVVYLTFDAGYEDGNTVKILDALKERGVKASFFLTGNYMKANPYWVKRIVDEGHAVYNHSMVHPDIYKLSSRDFVRDTKLVEDAYKQIVGKDMPKIYRPPSGAFDEQNLKDLQRMGYRTALWSIAYEDWQKKQPSKKTAFEKIIPHLHPGAIILLHTTSTTNAAIMGELIDKIHAEEYVIKEISTIKLP